jgi:putative hemolysin
MLRLVDESVAAPFPGASPIGWGFKESPYEFARRSLRELEIECTPSPESFARIPVRGRTLFVANHPFGALDGLLAIALLGAVRSDLRLLAGSDLAVIPELAPLMFGVDPFAKRHNTQRNAQALRYALRWLEHEHAVLAFPAGGIAHFDVRARCITDPPWSTAIGQVVKMTGAQVVPVHITGANSKLFQVAGVLSSRMRTFMLPREIRRQRRARIAVEVGVPIPAARLARFGDNEAVSMHLRLKTFLAATQTIQRPADAFAAAPAQEDAATAMPADALAREVDSLPARSLLVEQGDLQVYVADAASIPHLLSEIGRLRELTCRGIGAGTGRARDLDRFDRNHEHLFAWHRTRREIVGGYHIGRTDVIRSQHGKSGLGSAALFKYRDPFFTLLGPALELGKAFVRTEYQRGFAPWMLLWKGIGEIVGREPRYCRLIGPVNIGNNYAATSRQLLSGFLRTHCVDHMLASLVSARTPFPRERALGCVTTELAMLRNVDPLDALIEDIEPDGKGVPALLRHYLKLGARVLDFNDSENGRSVDCLLMVDLRHTKPRTLRKFLSESAIVRFAAKHRRAARLRREIDEEIAD